MLCYIFSVTIFDDNAVIILLTQMECVAKHACQITPLAIYVACSRYYMLDRKIKSSKKYGTQLQLVKSFVRLSH